MAKRKKTISEIICDAIAKSAEDFGACVEIADSRPGIRKALTREAMTIEVVAGGPITYHGGGLIFGDSYAWVVRVAR